MNTDDDDERGDICMALRDHGVDDVYVDEVGGMTIEDARLTFRHATGVEWNWEATKDRWVAESMEVPILHDAVYDPHGEHKHRYYEEN